MKQIIVHHRTPKELQANWDRAYNQLGIKGRYLRAMMFCSFVTVTYCSSYTTSILTDYFLATLWNGSKSKPWTQFLFRHFHKNQWLPSTIDTTTSKAITDESVRKWVGWVLEYCG